MLLTACVGELDSMVYHSDKFYDVPLSRNHTPFIQMSGQVDYWDLRLLMRFHFDLGVCH